MKVEPARFSKRYVKKCVEADDDIWILRTHLPRGPHTELGASPLSVDDFFYFKRGGEGFFNMIQDIRGEQIIAVNGRTYPKFDCAWIPTRAQLIEGLSNITFSIGDTKGLEEERILELFMEKRWNKSWDDQRMEWTRIQ